MKTKMWAAGLAVYLGCCSLLPALASENPELLRDRQRAASALKEKNPQRAIKVLEPWMTVEVNTPPEFSGGVLADLESRGARVRLVQDEGLRRIVRVEVPLAKMFGYATDLRSRSQGRADFTMSLCERRPVPAEEWQARGLS